LKDAADATGLEPRLVERFWTSIGLPPAALESLSDDDVQALHYVAAVLGAGFPLVAFLQLCRVYGVALSQIADAEVRLFHLYVHELMDHVHQRFLKHYVEQDVVGHMEMELGDEQLAPGRLRVAVAFADLAGYTRFTEEEGEDEALSSIERFVEGVTNTLPGNARVVKTIGDEVMVVGQDIAALVDWAVGFVGSFDERPEPRIGIHWGTALYRDGDYYGQEINLASRVVARARGGEVLATDSVVDAVRGSTYLVFEETGQVKLKGFDEPRQLCRVSLRE
jgi:adenylate cyclase